LDYIQLMTIDDVRRLIEPDEGELRARGVTALYVFGSVVREEAERTSDVDLIVDYDPRSNFNLIDLSAIRRHPSARFGVKVDVVTRNGIHRRIREQVLDEARAHHVMISPRARWHFIISSTRSGISKRS
jgi:predicted nucleotidyltransferase